MVKINPVWIRDAKHMSVEEFSYATHIPVSDIRTLESEKRSMTDLEESLIEAWEGGYTPAGIKAAVETLQALHDDVASIVKKDRAADRANSRGTQLFEKHYARLAYNVPRDRRMAKSAEASRLRRQAEQDQRDAEYYQDNPWEAQ